MTQDSQLAWEARTGRLAAGAAWASVALLAGGALLQFARLPRNLRGQAERLAVLDREAATVIATAVLQAVGSLLIAVVLVYLARAIRHRRAQGSAVLMPLAIAGPVVLGLVGLALQIQQVDAAGEFLASGARTDARAEAVRRGDGVLPIIAAVGLAGSLATGVAFILTGLNGMRAGLLSRFMGTLAILLGGLYVLPLVGGPGLLQLFWLGAVGVLILDRWPGGRGPAWRTGEAIPWPPREPPGDDAPRGRRGRRGARRAPDD